MKRITALLIPFLIHVACSGQSFKFRKYSEQDGLNNRFVYTLNQDELGNLMIGTGEGLYTYNGFSFTEVSGQQGLSDNFFTCSARGEDGSIWYGHNKGLITRYKNQQFEHFDISTFTQSRINCIQEDGQKNLWVITQNDGVLKKNADGVWTQYNKGIEEFTLYAFALDVYGHIWLGTDMGLIRCTIEEGDVLQTEWIDEIIETKVSCIVKRGSSFFAGTEDSGVYNIAPTETGASVQPVLCKGQPLQEYSINNIFMHEDGSMWLCTNNRGLVQLTNAVEYNYYKLISYRDQKQLKTPSVRICNTDREGTLWIGTMGDGLLKLTDDYLSIFAPEANKTDKDVYSIYEKNDSIWWGTTGKVYLSSEEPSNVIDSLDHRNGISLFPVTSVYMDHSGYFWIGNSNGELKILAPGSKKSKLYPLGTELQQQKINDIKGQQDFVYVATDYGLFQFQNHKLISHFTIQSGLPHNVIKSLHCDNEGRIWIASSNSRLTYIENGEIKNTDIPFEGVIIQISCITEDNFGNIWIGTDGLGVLKKDPSDQFTIYNKNSGLYSDYCYSIICDHRNKVWIGHHGAVSKLNILNNEIEIIDPGTSNDIDFIDNSVSQLPSGILLFGINQGILKYEPEKDQKNDQEPILYFTKIEINDSSQIAHHEIFLPYGEYKFTFDFIGASLKDPENVTYQYYLEGYESTWSDPTNSNSKDYSKISYGQYTFRVKCYNSDGYGGTQIIEYKINIDKPFWLKWWFLTGTAVLLILLARFIVLRRERNLREAQQRLKKALDERTKEVVEQKELLEEKNKDITDSIQYARNIQKAMLPSNDSLKAYFSDSLVYYKPRDIVSGDFYWVEQFEKTIVVSCADCTGHGVPGAFMSLIGSTLLKEVCNRKSVQCASDVLQHLDDELHRMLHKKGEMAIHDGMDIAVFDYNTETRRIHIASANRTVLFYHKNEWLELRGGRQSIGGRFNDSEKEFNQHEFTVEPGDIIYMFSDGITDQFGGANNKKLKRSGLLNWLKDITHLNLQDQRHIIKENFNKWKGEREQLDDIILIGIRF